jgi:cell division septation protein DedD
MTSDVRDARDGGEDGFHEIHLSGKQLVFLFMATTAISIVIFLCGVLVGRGVRGTAPVAQAAPPGSAAAVLEGTDAPGAAPAGETPSPDALSYFKQLGAEQAPVDELPAGAASEAAAAPVAAPKPAARPPETAPTSPAAAAAAAPPAAPPAGRRGQFTVQVAATRERAEADALARRLSGRGYQAYVDPSTGPGVRMYRVRVGSYPDRRDADRMRQRLEKEEKFKPWVTTR